MRKGLIIFILLLTSSVLHSQSNDNPHWQLWQDKTKQDSIRYEALNSFLTQGFLFNQPDSAYVLAKRLISYGKDHPKSSFQMKGLNVQGISKGIQGHYIESLDYFFEVLKISEGKDDKQWIAESLKNIGRVNTLIGDHTKALDYCQKALKIQEEIGDELGVTKSLSNIGLIQEKLEDYNGALENYKRALNIQEKMDDEKGIANTLILISGAYQSLGEYSNVEDHIRRSIDISKKQDNQRAIITAMSVLARNYNAKGEYKKAINAYEDLLPMVKTIGEANHEQNFYHHLYYAYKEIGNSSKALENYEKMIALRDSLYSIDTAKKIQQVEFDKKTLTDSLEQETEKHKMEMVHQAEVRRKDKNKNIAIAAGIFFLLISGGLYSRWNYTKKAKAVIEREKDRSESLLLNILPAEVAEELKHKGEAEARDYDVVSILFTDFKSFTEQSEKLTASALVKEINNCFKEFDAICDKYNVEKIKTIGDAYMAAGGLPVPEDLSVKNTVLAALEMQDFIVKQHQDKEAQGEHAFEMRVGVHTGPVVAGIVGVKKFQYDIWGDAVNTASRIESNGDVGKVNISEATYNYIKDDADFVFEGRGKVQAKGKGEVEMYFVSLA